MGRKAVALSILFVFFALAPLSLAYPEDDGAVEAPIGSKPESNGTKLDSPSESIDSKVKGKASEPKESPEEATGSKTSPSKDSKTPDSSASNSTTNESKSTAAGEKESVGDDTENPDDLDYDFDDGEDDEFDNIDDDDDFVDSPPDATGTSANSTSENPSDSEEAFPDVPKVNSTDDISTSGNCSKDISSFCKGLSTGGGIYLACLTAKLKEEKSANNEKAATVSSECKSEIRAFKVAMYKDITMDAKMQKECKTDIKKFCDDDFLYPEPGNILACLREVSAVDSVTEGCKAEVVRAKLDAAVDFLMDPQLNDLCGADATKLCSDVVPGDGRVQECLRAKRTKLSWDCQAELFRQEVENVNDIRLNVRLFQACLNDKKKFCNDVAPGDSKVKDCLEDHRLDPDFSTSCKEEFDKMMERRAVDFRLDPSLGKYCKADISEICYPDAEDITDVASWDAKVIQCLQDFRDELRNPKCRQQVRKLTKRAGEDYRFDKPFADACHEDRTTKCKDVPDGMAQVLRCLQDQRDSLKDMCRSALFDLEVRMAEEIDFLFDMKKQCAQEVTTLCKDVPEGHAAVIKCLQDKVEDAEMGAECKAEVKRNQLRAAQDYHLNYRLNKACYSDVQRTCLHVCDKSLENGTVTCGGSVLKCLSQNKKNLTSAACKKEIQQFEKQEAGDIRLDVPLQRACNGDLQKFCRNVSKDHTRTLACLRGNRDNLTKACQAEELRFSEMEASDIRLTPSLMNACGQELQVFCKEVSPEDGHAFKCLQANLEEVGMSAACKSEVNLQEARKASDYRLDISVKSVCEEDAQRICADVDRSNLGHAVMLKCFVRNYKKLSGSCQTEVAYAVRSALFQYRVGADLTAACDAEVSVKCASEEAKEIGGAVIGVYGQCLMGQNLTALNDNCRKLVKIMAKKGSHVSGKIDDGQLQEAISKLAAIQSGTGGGGFMLSGWVAIFTMVVILAVFLAAGYAVYVKYYSASSRYTLVVKSGDV